MGKDKDKAAPTELDLRSLLVVPTDPAEAREKLADIDPRSTPGGPENKEEAVARTDRYATELQELQVRLRANAENSRHRRILLVLQGMDTAGKGGVIKKTIGLLDPSALALHSFKAPTAEERKHHFLWRVRNNLPYPGQIGIFDRSHYEDVLIQKVHAMADTETIESRYDDINAFEQDLVGDGYTILKCFLNVSKDQQKERLLERLDNPDKHWKFNPADIDERQHWDDYQDAYLAALTRCSTSNARWYAVPADRKWYRNWAVGRLLLESLRDMDLEYPPTTFDVAEQRQRLLDESA
ncbi:PPK2 family polyphosphate kinase [Cumulibacter soli]|uniref:PPK2 family polyphosphate kinase n=1 Tax=Cumulibacter soli TaxID=2546344 RepID=UPI001067E94D|nr:PPK2 family polyphosphate kinase [Cumulibacter soli]